MKTIVILISSVFIGLHTYAQTATVTDENVLWIPAEPETNRFAISKPDMQKIAFVKSELGEIQSYKMSFKMGSLLYIKDMENTSFPEKAKELFIQSGAGTVLYLELMIKDKNSGTMINNNYELILGME